MAEKDVGFVGDVTNINSELLKTVLKDGYIPVVATVASDKDFQPLNINADLAAGEVHHNIMQLFAWIESE